MSSTLVVIGNLTRDVDLRFTQGGQAVASFSIASNRRKRKPGTDNEWDEVVTFFNCTAWSNLAENLAASLGKGDRVIASGYIEQRSFENKEGEQKTVMDFTVNDIGADMRYATVEVSRTERKTAEPSPRRESADEPF